VTAGSPTFRTRAWTVLPPTVPYGRPTDLPFASLVGEAVADPDKKNSLGNLCDEPPSCYRGGTRD